MNLRYGYTNSTRLENRVVVKTYSGADSQNRFLTELVMYQQLQDMPFMPELVGYDKDALTISTRYVESRHAQDLLEEHCDIVPFSLGKLARELQLVKVDAIAGSKRNEPDVLVHGDFGPQNLLFAPESFSERYLVDWEWAHFGDRFEDIAWAEWIIRMHYDSNQQMIASLYKGFGLVPPWETRHELMIRKCENILDFAKRDDDNTQAISMWIDRVAQVKSFEEKPWQRAARL
jgi:tRNA A-37 threonylcarbamoyl transferase component Bud32